MASRRSTPDHAPSGAGHLHRYRLVVVASGVSRLVRAAGGFLYDQARAGWDVRVLVDAPTNRRPLAILGVTEQERGTEAASLIRQLPRGGMLAVDAELLGSDPAVRDEVSRLAAAQRAEVTVWGRPSAFDVGRAFEAVTHPLGAAAAAFKQHALLAAGCDDSVAPAETLYRVRGTEFRRLRSV